jgi:hypothetical protein
MQDFIFLSCTENFQYFNQVWLITILHIKLWSKLLFGQVQCVDLSSMIPTKFNLYFSKVCTIYYAF